MNYETNRCHGIKKAIREAEKSCDDRQVFVSGGNERGHGNH